MQFALLGEIQFELITYFDGLEGRFGADYAEHALIEGKPRIQFIGDKLDEWSLQLKFHQLYCDPELEIVRLREAMRTHEPLPFVLATGEYKGEFVITDFSVTSEQTDLIGALVSVGATLSLKEHVPPPGVERVRYEAIAIQAPGKPAAPQVEKTVAGAQDTALVARTRQQGQAVGEARAANEAARLMIDAIRAARQWAGDPLGAIARLLSIAPRLADLGGYAGTLNDLAPDDATLLAADRIAAEAGQAQALIAELTPATLPAGLDALEHGMAGITRDLDQAGPAMTRLAAATAVRADFRGSAT